MGELASGDALGKMSLSMRTLWKDGAIMNKLDDRLWDLEGTDQWINFVFFSRSSSLSLSLSFFYYH